MKGRLISRKESCELHWNNYERFEQRIEPFVDRPVPPDRLLVPDVQIRSRFRIAIVAERGVALVRLREEVAPGRVGEGREGERLLERGRGASVRGVVGRCRDRVARERACVVVCAAVNARIGVGGIVVAGCSFSSDARGRRGRRRRSDPFAGAFRHARIEQHVEEAGE